MDCVALKKALKKRGIKYKNIAEQLGITPNSFSRKVNGESELKLSEVEKLIQILGLNESEKKQIFLKTL